MSNPAVVYRVRAVAVDDGMGGTVRDWDNATSQPVEGVVWAPIQAGETTDLGREGRVIGWRLYKKGSPPDLVATDRLTWDGDLYDIDGEPARYRHPVTGTQITEITVGRVQG